LIGKKFTRRIKAQKYFSMENFSRRIFPTRQKHLKKKNFTGEIISPFRENFLDLGRKRFKRGKASSFPGNFSPTSIF